MDRPVFLLRHVLSDTQRKRYDSTLTDMDSGMLGYTTNTVRDSG